MKLSLPLLFAIAVCAVNVTSAQSTYYKDEFNELSLNVGAITIEELNGYGARGTQWGNFTSTPHLTSGALFITYRRTITSWFYLGVGAGIDDEAGGLTYGDPKFVMGGSDAESGHYKVHTFTLAAEALFAYKKREDFMFYGYLGFGGAYFNEVYTLNSYSVGSPHLPELPSNPYNYKDVHWTAQVTPIGMRFGDEVAGFLEFGFGYKGLISGGLSVRF